MRRKVEGRSWQKESEEGEGPGQKGQTTLPSTLFYVCDMHNMTAAVIQSKYSRYFCVVATVHMVMVSEGAVQQF